MRSYFKAVLPNKTSHTVFFEDSILESIQDAFALICEIPNARISVFKPTPIPGPWDAVGLIGHRTRDQIKTDMSRTTNAESLFWLKEELDAVDAAWLDAGRETVPTAVAA